MRTTVTLILLLSNAAVLAQHCSEVLITTPPTVNTWDWRTQYWSANAYTNGGPGVITSVLSPFYNGDNINLLPLAAFAVKDYHPEDGWELIKRNLGNAGQTPINNAYVVFYNKFTSVIRVFFLVTQTFSNVGSNGSANAMIRISFTDNVLFPYQSNLLTTYSAPLLPLDQFKRNIDLRTPGIFFNQLPYWLYVEFPVAYDPCTCGKSGYLRIELKFLESANIEFDLNAQPYQKTVVNGQIDSNKDWATSFTKIGEQVEGGVKVARTSGEALGKFLAGIDKQVKPGLKAKLTADNLALTEAVDALGAWTDLVPSAGKAVKSVISLVDYFSSGGKTTTSTAGPSSVMILNNFKAKGSITSEVNKNEIAFAIPGSNQSGVDPSLIPIYNNTLGVFNLLYTPKVKMRSNPVDYNSRVAIQYCQSGIPSFEKYQGKLRTYFSIQEDIKYVVNPAANIDLSRSDIRGAIIIEDCENIYSTNLDVDVANGSISTFRTAYHPIAAI